MYESLSALNWYLASGPKKEKKEKRKKKMESVMYDT